MCHACARVGAEPLPATLKIGAGRDIEAKLVVHGVCCVPARPACTGLGRTQSSKRGPHHQGLARALAEQYHTPMVLRAFSIDNRRSSFRSARAFERGGPLRSRARTRRASAGAHGHGKSAWILPVTPNSQSSAPSTGQGGRAHRGERRTRARMGPSALAPSPSRLIRINRTETPAPPTRRSDRSHSLRRDRRRTPSSS